MANQEQLDILKQGVEVWNEWREANPETRPDLRGAIIALIDSFSEVNLSEALLSGVHLSFTYLRQANFRGADLGGATLSHADLDRAHLNGANLNRAHLNGTDLSLADFSEANLAFADLTEANLSLAHLNRANLNRANLAFADLSSAHLDGADLSEANLSGVILRAANLSGVNLSGATVGSTTFGGLDLRRVKGLETLDHRGPSTIGIDTIIHSQGKIPEIFLREAGVPPSIIEAIPSLIGSLEPIQYYTCFISYSSKDQGFAERLYADLQSKGVRCWFAPEDLKIGEKFWHRIDESIRLHDKLLVVLSEHSVTSVWVENEVMAALEKEHQQQKLVLFPIKLDDTVMQTTLPWAANIRRSRHIGNFTKWKQHDDYQKGLNRLLRDLKAST